MWRLFLSILIVASACAEEKKDTEQTVVQSKLQLLEADKNFSDYSEEKGMRTAFIEYMDSNAILLRPNHLPVVGAHAVDYLLGEDDGGYTLKWKSKDAVIASSGDLGFTYGVWALQPKTQDTVLYGTYVSIWKKQANGKWKFLLDAGNNGIGQEIDTTN